MFKKIFFFALTLVVCQMGTVFADAAIFSAHEPKLLVDDVIYDFELDTVRLENPQVTSDLAKCTDLYVSYRAPVGSKVCVYVRPGKGGAGYSREIMVTEPEGHVVLPVYMPRENGKSINVGLQVNCYAKFIETEYGRKETEKVVFSKRYRYWMHISREDDMLDMFLSLI